MKLFTTNTYIRVNPFFRIARYTSTEEDFYLNQNLLIKIIFHTIVKLIKHFCIQNYWGWKALANEQSIKHIFFLFDLFYVHSVRFNSFLPTHTHTHTHIYIYRERERERKTDRLTETNRERERERERESYERSLERNETSLETMWMLLFTKPLLAQERQRPYLLDPVATKLSFFLKLTIHLKRKFWGRGSH